MGLVGAVLVDFDGTACTHDVAEHLLVEFGDPSWPTYDDAFDRGEIGLRDAIAAQASLIDAPQERLHSYAIDHCPMDPTFSPFARWCGELGVSLTLVSDGFGFYIEPVLRAAGIEDLDVVTNRWIRNDGRPATLAFPNAHQVCGGCGTCKMQAVLRAREAHGPVAFVGDGRTDRYGALYADIAFAKGSLAEYCKNHDVPFVPWTSFDDVRHRLSSSAELPGPVAPIPCPGWTTS